jgi:O-methyltransferase domain
MTDTPTPNADRQELDLLLRGFQVSRMLRLVADFGVADIIPSDSPISVQELSGRCAVSPEPMLRVLRVLAAFKIFRIGKDGLIAHTARSRLLRTDTPNSMHHAARFWTGRGSWGAWGMLDVAMTGGIPHEAAWNMTRFDYLRAHPDEARIFDAMMANIPDNRHAIFAASYDFSGAGLIADIGGGNGAALRHILTRFPGVSGLVYDRADVIEALTPADLMLGRITAASGSFFDRVPEGADVYMLVKVLHDWPDEDCLEILRVCRAAIGPRSLLLIGEQILENDPEDGEATAYLIDTQMMAMFGRARERSESDFAELLDKSGFTLGRVIPTDSPISILEAVLREPHPAK